MQGLGISHKYTHGTSIHTVTVLIFKKIVIEFGLQTDNNLELDDLDGPKSQTALKLAATNIPI